MKPFAFIKKCISLILSVLLLLLSSSVITYATNTVVDKPSVVSFSETQAMKSAMETRGIGGDISIEILYDSNNKPSFLLGVSDSGYQIIARDTLMCIEGGEANPYASCPKGKKVYGGLLSYYVATNDGYYDICRDTSVSSIRQSDYLNSAIYGSRQEGAAFSASASADATVTFTKIIPDAYTKIQRKAFGYNDDNTCSAVACTIVLDYLDYYNGVVVPTEFHLENLTTQNGTNVATHSPKAHAFHRILVEECGMGPVSYANGITNAIDNYRESSPYTRYSEIDCEWTLNIYTNFGIDELLNDRPTMLTSTLSNGYSWHTMPVYGYRRFSDNSLEWLVHPGWHNRLAQDNTVWHMPEIWVAASTATYLYRFTCIGM